jgi:hypothetical protein
MIMDEAKTLAASIMIANSCEESGLRGLDITEDMFPLFVMDAVGRAGSVIVSLYDYDKKRVAIAGTGLLTDDNLKKALFIEYMESRRDNMPDFGVMIACAYRSLLVGIDVLLRFEDSKIDDMVRSFTRNGDVGHA